MSEEVIVRDEEIVVLAPKKAFTAGHVIITTVQEYSILEEVPQHVITRMFQIANRLSTVLFEQMKCQGTNILIQNGIAAGQINTRFSINVLPRFENDNVKLEWTPGIADPEKIQSAFSKFENSIKDEDEKKKQAEQKEKAKLNSAQVIKSNDEKKKRNYFVRSLEKVA